MHRPKTADFDSYPLQSELVDAELGEHWITVRWGDGYSARYHHVWLRDNCPCDGCVQDGTREQTFELLAVPVDIHAVSAVANRAALTVVWSGTDQHQSDYDAGWLRRHAYSESVPADELPETVLWGAELGMPPTFSGPDVLTDEDALYDWACGLASHGCSLLRNLSTGTDVGDIARRLGPIRDTNFGLLWDVVADPDPITNANTALSLPPHVDLPTREYQPGIQLLHCLVNEVEGGESVLVDGFRLAAEVREQRPDYYELLCTIPWNWSNRSKTSDYRYVAPVLGTDRSGALREIRLGNWLRAPLTSAAFDQVEQGYAAYRYIFALSFEDRFALRFRLCPGDCMVFDNRRVLHARTAFSTGAGHRRLRGCYTERDELYSRIRMLQRAKRAAAIAASRNS